MVHVTTASFALALIGLASPAVAHLISYESHPRHQQLAERLEQNTERNHTLAKRWQFTGKRATWYDAGLGACGKTNKGSDFIVALNTPQMKELNSDWPSKQCWKTITISYGGKTAQAQITDECPVCPYGGLDFSKGLFSYFADLGKGVLAVDWSFNDGSGGSSSGGGSSSDDDDDKEEDDDDNEAWLSQSSKSAKSVQSTRSEASEASMETVRSVSSVSAKSEASIASESAESKASISSLSAASVRSTRSEASVLSTQSVASVSSVSVAAYASTADLPVETSVTLNSVQDTDANNLGVVKQLLLNFGNIAVVGKA